MKATDRQKEIINACIAELTSWRDNNDITSPTNLNEIETSINLLKLDSRSENEIIESLKDLWFTILRNK